MFLELGVAHRSARWLGLPAMNQLATRKGMLHRFSPQRLSTSDSLISDESRRIREWLLGILRFAVTLEQRDQAAVMCLAAEMDRLGADTIQSQFSYFSRTSVEFCNCILGCWSVANSTELRLHLQKINDGRLRRALEAALFEKTGSVRSKKLDRVNLHRPYSAA
jgi:hypothetical protein